MPAQPENPYQISRPLTEPRDLFGRKMELELCYQMLKSGESVNIVGPRRIGKSSFLKVFPKPETQQCLFGKPILDENILFCYLDLESQKKATPLQFLQELLEQLLKTGQKINPAIESYKDFEAVISGITDQKKRLILVLDEFDCVVENEQFDIQLFDMLRYYQQQYSVSYIIASCERIKKITRSSVASSPFFNIFRFLRLGLLQTPEADELICKDAALLPYKYYVRFIAGEHPFFISLFCFYVFSFKSADPDLSFAKVNEKALEYYLEEALDHFIYYWEHLSGDERSVLKKLAIGKKIVSKAFPELEDLVQKALLKEEKGEFKLYSYSFEGFVKQVGFSKIKEDLSSYFSTNKKALIAISKYCIDKLVDLKKS